MADKVSYHPEQQFEVHTRDITYRAEEKGQDRPARIYLPVKSGPLPALIDVHGGAWSSGDCTTNEVIDMALARSGLLVFAIGCRTAQAYPSQVADVNYATRWLKAHAKTFNASADHIGGLGTSSGGHSLFLSAMRPEDPLARYDFARENAIGFLVEKTEAYFKTRDAMAEGNPQMALAGRESLDLPPVLMIEGTADENLPSGSAERFTRAYSQAGGRAQLELFEGLPHGFALTPGEASDRAIALIKGFISRQFNRAV